MQSLYDRLLPEYKEQLAAEADKYPTSVAALLKQLHENNSVFDLTYHAVYSLQMHTTLQSLGPLHILTAFKDTTHE